MQLRELTSDDAETICALARRLTGAYDDGKRREVLVANVFRRMVATGALELADYLRLARDDDGEYARLLSALTIHTTSWFREMPHFEAIESLGADFGRRLGGGPLRALSAGCSTGQEPYSLALTLEHMRLDYAVEGVDIDFVSVNTARRGIYAASELEQIPARFREPVRLGSGKTAGLFTLSPELRARCKFQQASLLELGGLPEKAYHLILCRNVMIYFTPPKIEAIVRGLTARLAPGGLLALGHSEAIDAAAFGLRACGHALYRRAVTPVAPVVAQKLSRSNQAKHTKPPELILAGASTGGTEALLKLFRGMPAGSPPVLIVQHIAPTFARSFAERLAEVSRLKLGAIQEGEKLRDGHLYMALGDYHLGVKPSGRDLVLALSNKPKLHSVRPAVDHLFRSVAELVPFRACAAILLTGMGKDGAEGLLELSRRGARTLVQDEASSVVFGMPREAIAVGAAGYVGTPEAIRGEIEASLTAA